jgi:2-keto-4-pentenoate hydratase/2-oxohepta-3-ene-1,7-dioic acid hydratase in catechol pathway
MNRPPKIVCIGRNYVDHAKEMGNDVPKEPLIFLKPSTSVIGNGQSIVLPPQSQQVEHEGEIGIIIGRTLRNVSPEEARQGVSKVVAVNDVTARDLQRQDSQWTRAKGFDTFCPIGEGAEPPADLSNLTVVCRVNGVERQRGKSSDMVFDIPYLLSILSRRFPRRSASCSSVVSTSSTSAPATRISRHRPVRSRRSRPRCTIQR